VNYGFSDFFYGTFPVYLGSNDYLTGSAFLPANQSSTYKAATLPIQSGYKSL